MTKNTRRETALTLEKKLQQTLVPVDEQPYPVPGNWCWTLLGCISSVKGGKRVPKGKHFSEIKTSHPYIRVTDFDNHTVNTSELKYIDEEVFSVIKNYTISVKDIYISVAGSIGKVGIIPDCLDGSNLTENAAKITEIKCIQQKYLLWYLISEFAQYQMKQSTISTTQPKLALFRIEKIYIPLPPLSEQQRIVARIESLFAKLDEVKEKAPLPIIDTMKKSILARAFRGELGTNDPSDEPTIELLKKELQDK